MAFIGNSNSTQSAVASINYFNGNGSTTAFTLTFTPQSVAQVQVYINNVPQNPANAFSISGTTLTFTSAPPSGSSNIVVYYAASTNLFPGNNATGIIGGDNSTLFYQNSNTISTPYAIPANKNVMTIGPVAVNATVTVSSGLWKIV
jgi:hypothetical protein